MQGLQMQGLQVQSWKRGMLMNEILDERAGPLQLPIGTDLLLVEHGVGYPNPQRG
jgi:hypothetical protein